VAVKGIKILFFVSFIPSGISGYLDEAPLIKNNN
jgi:hypothetical protein